MKSDENVTPASAEELSVKIDFDGEERSYSISEIKVLAQKGLDYGLIIGDYERIKQMARQNDKNVSEYLSFLEAQRFEARRAELLEKCGDEELAGYILNLESECNTFDNRSFKELKEYFPNITDISELPECVVNSAKVKGSSIVDEWLRYRHKKQMRLSALNNLEASAANSSIGSQREHIAADYDPAKLQFIKGIWGK